MLVTRRKLNRVMLLLAAVAALLVALLPSACYYMITCRYYQGMMDTEVGHMARLVEGMIKDYPGFWKYQTLRMEELLKRQHRIDYPRTFLVTDVAGAIIARNGEDLPGPIIFSNRLIYDAGMPVARVEIQRSLRPVLFRASLVFLVSAGFAVLVFLVLRLLPIRAVAAAQHALSKSESRYRSLFTNMKDPALLLEIVPGWTKAVIREANPACGFAFNKNIGSLIGATTDRLFGADDKVLLEVFRKVSRSGDQMSLDHEFTHLGKVFAMSVTPGEDGRMAVMFSDITEHRARELRIQHLMSFDPLTGLPNRALLSDRLKQAIAGSDRDHRRIAVIMLDLDQFKAINDSLGHEAGNRVLKSVAERLTNVVRRTDTVARLGGDEFVIVVSGMRGELNASLVAGSVLASLGEPFQTEGRDVFVTGAIGIAVYPEDGADEATLLKNADLAMCSAKEKGRNQYRYYSRQLNQRAMERLEAETSLRLALKEGHLSLAYQPQVDAVSGSVNGVEALLRWDNRNGFQEMKPERIISIAEQMGLIPEIGAWVMDAACAQARCWLDSGIRLSRIAVNVSAKQFDLQELAPVVKDILERNGIPNGMLELELTESAVISHPEDAARKLLELKGLGVSLALDDFGTGCSSLSYLKHFPFDRVKIDRSFVREVVAVPGDAAIVEAVIALARGLRLKVIAEGVELREQMEFLRSLGCDEMQGFFFARPMTAEECAGILAAGQIDLEDRISMESVPAVLVP